MEQSSPLVFNMIVHPFFKNIVVPVITLALTICFKASSKKNFSLEMADFFVCFDLCASALFLFLIGMIDLVDKLINPPNAKIASILKSSTIDQNQISTLKELLNTQTQIITNKFALSWGILFIMLILTFILSVFTRSFGWDSSGKLKFWEGIVIPNLLGFVLLVVATNWIRL